MARDRVTSVERDERREDSASARRCTMSRVTGPSMSKAVTARRLTGAALAGAALALVGVALVEIVARAGDVGGEVEPPCSAGDLAEVWNRVRLAPGLELHISSELPRF